MLRVYCWKSSVMFHFIVSTNSSFSFFCCTCYMAKSNKSNHVILWIPDEFLVGAKSLQVKRIFFWLVGIYLYERIHRICGKTLRSNTLGYNIVHCSHISFLNSYTEIKKCKCSTGWYLLFSILTGSQKKLSVIPAFLCLLSWKRILRVRFLASRQMLRATNIAVDS